MNDKRLRIIIIDDSPTMTRMLEAALSRLGHQVMTFTDPSICPAVKKPDCDCPQEFPCADIIISDFMMPGMNGIDFFRRQRENGCKALDANKALMSGVITPQMQKAIAELGCHFIKKPFKIKEVVRWVEECAGRIEEDRVLADFR